MLPIGSVGMLSMIVAAYPMYRAHDYGPLRCRARNLHAARKHTAVPVAARG